MKKLSLNKYSFLIWAVFLLLIAVIYFFNQGYYIGRNPYPSGDEPDYLVGAMKIKEYGGPSKFISYLVSGSFLEARKHPLYMFLLSFFADKSLDFFVYSKFFNFILGGALLTMSYFIMKKMFNVFAAIFFVLILSLSELFLAETALVVPDNLMALLILLACYFYYLGFENVKNLRTKHWVLGSFFCGLAYLTKPNGIFLLVAFFLTALLLLRKRIFKSKSFFVAVSVFLLVTSPLLIRNFVLYKNPFYNNNVSLLWIENRQERRAPDFNQASPTILTYFAEKGVVNEIKLYAENSVKMASNFSMLILFGEWRWRFSFPLLFLAVFSMILDKKKKRALFFGVFFGISYLFFAYNYKVSPHYRHIMPIIFIPVGYVSLLFERAPFLSSRRKKLVYKIATIALVAGGLFFGYNKLYTEKRLSKEVFEGQVDISAVHIGTRNWLVSNMKDNKSYVMGLDDNFMFTWYTDIKGKRIIQPYFSSFEKFSKFLIQNKVNYVVLGGQTVNSFPEIYQDYFEKKKNSPDYLRRIATPEKWVMVFNFPFENEEHFKVLIYDVSVLWK
ncbi:MAG: glycosyltransferase family 39 protein [Patescibacteria group bacterium]